MKAAKPKENVNNVIPFRVQVFILFRFETNKSTFCSRAKFKSTFVTKFSNVMAITIYPNVVGCRARMRIEMAAILSLEN